LTPYSHAIVDLLLRCLLNISANAPATSFCTGELFGRHRLVGPARRGREHGNGAVQAGCGARSDARFVDAWIRLASTPAAPALVKSVLRPESGAVARLRTACKSEEGAVDGDGRGSSCCWIGRVVVGATAGPPNLAYMGRNAAPKAVERESEGRSGGEDP
jgi:hypothetical protein